jgi:hypothetical protein
MKKNKERPAKAPSIAWYLFKQELKNTKKNIVFFIDFFFVLSAGSSLYRLLSIKFDYHNFIELYIGNKEFIESYGLVYTSMNTYYGYHIFQLILSLFFLKMPKLHREYSGLLKISLIILFQILLMIFL